MWWCEGLGGVWWCHGGCGRGDGGCVVPLLVRFARALEVLACESAGIIAVLLGLDVGRRWRGAAAADDEDMAKEWLVCPSCCSVSCAEG
jgi:hypothetical protein